jgi:hypothetical protein
MFQDYVMECVRRDRDDRLLRNAEREWLVKGVSASQPRFRDRLLSAVTRLLVTADLWLAARYHPRLTETWNRH